MIQDIMHRVFINLSDNKKLDYLYILLVEKDNKKLMKRYGPKQISVSFSDKFVLIVAPSLQDARMIKNGLISEGIILERERYNKQKDLYAVSYTYIGSVEPLCLN